MTVIQLIWRDEIGRQWTEYEGFYLVAELCACGLGHWHLWMVQDEPQPGRLVTYGDDVGVYNTLAEAKEMAEDSISEFLILDAEAVAAGGRLN